MRRRTCNVKNDMRLLRMSGRLGNWLLDQTLMPYDYDTLLPQRKKGASRAPISLFGWRGKA